MRNVTAARIVALAGGLGTFGMLNPAHAAHNHQAAAGAAVVRTALHFVGYAFHRGGATPQMGFGPMGFNDPHDGNYWATHFLAANRPWVNH